MEGAPHLCLPSGSPHVVAGQAVSDPRGGGSNRVQMENLIEMSIRRTHAGVPRQRVRSGLS